MVEGGAPPIKRFLGNAGYSLQGPSEWVVRLLRPRCIVLQPLDAFHLPQHGVVPLLAGVAVGVGSIHGELATVHVAEVLNVSPDGLFPA